VCLAVDLGYIIDVKRKQQQQLPTSRPVTGNFNCVLCFEVMKEAHLQA
jgi:hypothetical protein